MLYLHLNLHSCNLILNLTYSLRLLVSLRSLSFQISSISSIWVRRTRDLLLASQLVTQVEYEKQQEISAQNGKQKAAEHIVAQVGNGNLMAECVQPPQVSIPNSIEHSNGEELSDSEDELLEVLEGVVSSKQEVEALSQSIAAKSLIAPRSELEIFPTPEPPDHLAPGVTGEPVTLYSNGDTGFNKHLSKSTKRRLRKQA
ncbi:hypothetical protein RHSIM_Rhsim04G0148400 [Rhododendron simsii]|uniref:Uncharacterized protein n=1 Tax=Rhododendron simsii TaxID=118357 RepID=A0A834LQL9_RHOSS|nr:hypothetical protein RHSIM_Rhsim04G0148400 [Rhododendron simsii]